MAIATTAAGGILGAGGTVALRETMDVQNGEPNNFFGTADSFVGRVSRPSALWGLGGGALMGLAYLGDTKFNLYNVNSTVEDVMLGWAVGGVPAGIGSALMPKEAGTAATAAMSNRSRSRSRSLTRRSGSSGSSSNGSTDEFAEAQ